MPFEVRREHDIAGKTYLVGDLDTIYCMVIFFTWAVDPKPGSIPVSVGSVSKPYFALLRDKVTPGAAWHTVSVPRSPNATWNEHDWQKLAVEVVENYLAAYIGPRPSRFDREDVI